MDSDFKKRFKGHMSILQHSHHAWQVWQDFVEMAALSIMQSVEYSESREERYMQTVGRYTHDEAQVFPKMLACVVEALEAQYCDFLGEVFMEMELGNKWTGQFFTPYNLCDLLASLTIDLRAFDDGNVVTMNEPAVGGGAMVIAACDYLKGKGINYQRQLKVRVQDVSYVAFCMSYIQLSLIGCNAEVVLGDTLSCECREMFITPINKMQMIGAM